MEAMRKFAPQPETEKESGVSPLPEVANDHDTPSIEAPATFRAVNDNDTLYRGVAFSVPEAANDDVPQAVEQSVQEAEAVKVREVRERLQAHREANVVPEALSVEPLLQPEALNMAVEAPAQPEAAPNPAEERATTQPEVVVAPIAVGGTTAGGGSQGGGTTKKVESAPARKGGGKLWGFMKGIGKFLGFVAFAPIAAAFKLMHYGTDKIMSFAGAEGAKKGGKK